MLLDDVIAANLVPSREDLAGLPAFDFTDVCEVVVEAGDDDDKTVLAVRDCVNCCPPFDEFWMESSKFPVDVGDTGQRIAVHRWGCLVLKVQEGDVHAYQMVPFVRYKSGNLRMLPPNILVAMTEHWDGLGAMAIDRESGQEDSGAAAGIADVFAIPILRALTFLACSNAEVKSVPRGPSSKKRERRGLPPLVGYSRIMVPGGSRVEAGASPDGTHKALHRVRGHFCRRRREDWGKPGAVWWRQSHVRGEPALGLRVGRYQLGERPAPSRCRACRPGHDAAADRPNDPLVDLL